MTNFIYLPCLVWKPIIRMETAVWNRIFIVTFLTSIFLTFYWVSFARSSFIFWFYYILYYYFYFLVLYFCWYCRYYLKCSCSVGVYFSEGFIWVNKDDKKNPHSRGKNVKTVNPYLCRIRQLPSFQVSEKEKPAGGSSLRGWAHDSDVTLLSSVINWTENISSCPQSLRPSGVQPVSSWSPSFLILQAGPESHLVLMVRWFRNTLELKPSDENNSEYFSYSISLFSASVKIRAVRFWLF